MKQRTVLGRREVMGWGLAQVLMPACRRRDGPPAEPTGGQWKPVVLAPDQLIQAPPPPAPGSTAERAERAELLELRRRRDDRAEPASPWLKGACVHWNETARELVARHRTDYTFASRVYALTSVAQYDALVSTWHNKYRFRRPRPADKDATVAPSLPASPDPGYPSEHAAVAAASASVLSYLYPEEAGSLTGQASRHCESQLWAGLSFRSDIEAGDAIGRAVATRIIQRARDDGSDRAREGTLATGPNRWFSAPGDEPVDPHWGRVKPWLIDPIDALRAPPPPPVGSPEFASAVSEVKQASDRRSPAQLRMAALWADGDGSYAPAGRWNKTACDLFVMFGWGELRVARALALINMAIMDAGIACWESKYHYFVPRPSHREPTITLPVGLPNHPSYPSAHATFSGAGEGVLAHLFPVHAGDLRADAEEATLSRLYGGIHYRFDGVAGLQQGRRAAAAAIKRGAQDGAPP